MILYCELPLGIRDTDVSYDIWKKGRVGSAERRADGKRIGHLVLGVHPTTIHPWKRALLEGASGVFERGDRKAPEVDDEQVKDLHAMIGGWPSPTIFRPQPHRAADRTGAKRD